MDLYAENILDHFRHPRGKVVVAAPTSTHEEVNLSCGDALTIQMTISNDRIIALGWNGSGCAISQAAMSMLWEKLQDKDLAAIDALTAKDIAALLGVPISPRRAKCAYLCLHALKNLLHSIRRLPPQSWSITLGAADED